MIRMMKPGPMFALLALAACATTPIVPPGTALLAGLPGDEVKIAWGVADDIVTQADGSEVWTYHKTWIAYGGNDYDSYPASSESKSYTDANGDTHKVTTNYYRAEFNDLTRDSEHCDIVFQVGPDGRVKSVEFTGDCDDYKRKAVAQHKAWFVPAAAADSSSSSAVAPQAPAG